MMELVVSRGSLAPRDIKVFTFFLETHNFKKNIYRSIYLSTCIYRKYYLLKDF